MVVGALVVVAPACADEVVAELTRDTPIAAYGGVVAWSDYDAATARYRLVIRWGAEAMRGSMASSQWPFDISLTAPDDKPKWWRCTLGSNRRKARYRLGATQNDATRSICRRCSLA
jgi:hypothetical protein